MHATPKHIEIKPNKRSRNPPIVIETVHEAIIEIGMTSILKERMGIHAPYKKQSTSTFLNSALFESLLFPVMK
jgi:hypothetical protein